MKQTQVFMHHAVTNIMKAGQSASAIEQQMQSRANSDIPNSNTQYLQRASPSLIQSTSLTKAELKAQSQRVETQATCK